MLNSLILTIHIIGGSFSIISGMTAMLAKKGSALHISSGRVFFFSMIAMTVCATYLAVFHGQSTNIIAASLTLYLVLTAQRTAANRSGKTGRNELVHALFALCIVIVGASFGIETYEDKVSTGDNFTPLDFFLYFFTGMAAFGLLMDSIVILRGGISGAYRMARHLWRMCFALWIATSSLFLGQPQVFPKPLSHPLILSLPVILVVMVWFFWNIKVFITRRFKV